MFNGLVGLIQVLLIPGAIILCEIQKKSSLLFTRLEWIIFSISLSLIVNFVFIYWLVGIFHFEPTSALFVPIIFEFVWLTINFKSIKKIQFESLNEKNSGFLEFLFIGLSLSQFLYFFRKPLDLMWGWDGALSWQRWAIDWFHGIWPTNTWKYPQLIPATWSIIYTFLGTCDIHIFSRFLTNLFPVITTLSWLVLYKRTQRFSDLLAGFFSLLFFNLYIPHLLFTDGMVDFSLLFFVVASFICLRIFLFYNSSKDLKNEHFIWLYFFVGIGLMSAAVKQGGLVWFIISSAIGLYLLKKTKTLKSNSIGKFIVVTILIATCLSWYIIKQVEILRGIDFSETAWIAKGLYSQFTPIERFILSMKGIFGSSVPRFVFALVFFGGIFLKFLNLGKSRWIDRSLFIFAIVFFIWWGLYFSYLGDPKNLGFVIPLFCYYSAQCWSGLALQYPSLFRKKPVIILASSVAVILLNIYLFQNHDWVFIKVSLYAKLLLSTLIILFLSYYSRKISKRTRDLTAAGFLILIAIFLCIHFPTHELQKIQTADLMRQGYPNLNISLREAIKRNQIYGNVYSDYGFFKVLPDFRKYYYFVPDRFSFSFLKKLETREYPYQFILVRKSGRMYDNLGPYTMGKETRVELDRKIQTEEMKLIFEATDPSPEYNGDLETFQLIQVELNRK